MDSAASRLRGAILEPARIGAIQFENAHWNIYLIEESDGASALENTTGTVKPAQSQTPMTFKMGRG